MTAVIDRVRVMVASDHMKPGSKQFDFLRAGLAVQLSKAQSLACTNAIVLVDAMEFLL